jgi:hypothetical protein
VTERITRALAYAGFTLVPPRADATTPPPFVAADAVIEPQALLVLAQTAGRPRRHVDAERDRGASSAGGPGRRAGQRAPLTATDLGMLAAARATTGCSCGYRQPSASASTRRRMRGASSGAC